MFHPNQPAFNSDSSLTRQEWLYGTVLSALCSNPNVIKFKQSGEFDFDHESIVLLAQSIVTDVVRNFNDAVVEPDDETPELFEWNTHAITRPDLMGKRHPDAEIRAPQARR